MPTTQAVIRASRWGAEADRSEETIRTAFAAFLALFIAGCASLPDVKPFATATLSLEKSVDESFAASARAQRQMAGLLDVKRDNPAFEQLQSRKKEYEGLAKLIEDERAPRVQLMRALTDYTDSLAAIVEASQNAQANVDALANSTLQLAAVFRASPLPAVVAPAVDLAKLAATEAVKIRASRDLRRGLELGEPVVQNAAKILLADIADLRKSVATKDAAVMAATSLAGGDPLKYRERLLERRSELMKKLAGSSGEIPIESQTPSADLEKVAAQLAASDAWYLPLAERRDKALSDLQAAQQLYAKVEEAISQWGRAYADLVAAAQAGRTVNVRRLVELVLEVKAIVAKIEKEASDGSR